MILIEAIESTKIAVEQILVSKLRSFLSILGVVIGISVVILMGWLVYALDTVVESTFQIMGTDMLWVSRFDWAGGKSWEELRNRKKLKLDIAEEFKAQMASAELVTIQTSAWGNNAIKYAGETYQGMNIEGDDFSFQYTPNGEITEGRYFSQMELQHAANVAIIGTKISDAVFPTGGADGKTIKIKDKNFLIIGIFKKQGTMMMDFIDNRIAVPLSTFLLVYGKERDVSIGVKAGNLEKLDEVRYETQGIMRSLRNLHPGQEDDFSINESKVFEETTKTIRLAVYSVGIGMTALSFLVGIIGIMNIMFVSVTERTKEIGIRKAVGAKNRSILMQFIIEAAMLCLIGAIFSFILCSILVLVVANVLPKFVPNTAFLSPTLPMNLLVIASFISIFVGIIAGLIPAIRASKLDPIDSLRYE